MASKGLRGISCQVTRKVEAGYKPSHTTETLIGYTACERSFIVKLKKFDLLILLLKKSLLYIAPLCPRMQSF